MNLPGISLRAMGTLFLGTLCALGLGCGGGGGNAGQAGPEPTPALSLSPSGPVHLAESQSVALLPAVTGLSSPAVSWTVDGIANGNPAVGTLTLNGRAMRYTAPAGSGSHTVMASAVNGQVSYSVPMLVGATCDPAPTSSVSVNVKDAPYAAKGDGVTDDTAAIQSAVDAVAGTGATVTVPPGTFLINPARNGHAGIRLGNQMTFRLMPGATLQAESTSSSDYVVLLASGVANVTIVGGTSTMRQKKTSCGQPLPPLKACLAKRP